MWRLSEAMDWQGMVVEVDFCQTVLDSFAVEVDSCRTVLDSVEGEGGGWDGRGREPRWVGKGKGRGRARR